MDQQKEMTQSLVKIEAHINDPWLRVMRDKCPIRRVQGLESIGDSNEEYDPSNTYSTACHLVTPTRHSVTSSRASPHLLEDYREIEIPSRDPVICLILQRIQKNEDDRTYSIEPEWSKLRPGSLTDWI